MFGNAYETNVSEGSATARKGTTITGSATPHTKGSWTELIASTAADAEGVFVRITDVQASATDTRVLLDIGTGAAASEVVLIENIDGGGAGNDARAKTYFFPVAIASGTRVSARLQGTQASETAVVAIALVQGTQHLDGASAMEAVGDDTADSGGVPVTPGSANTWGNWTSMGTISADRNLFMPAMNQDGNTASPGGQVDLVMQMGYGSSAPGSGGTAITGTWVFYLGSDESASGPFPPQPVYADLASGETLWVRLATGGTDARGVIVYAMEAPAAAGGGSAVIRR